jgi:DNA ligase 1
MKPMLAATLKDLKDLQFPCLVQPKYDGLRNLTNKGVGLSRKLKPIPNKHVQKMLSIIDIPDGLTLDGELLCTTFNETQSKIMSHDGEPEFTYWIFDSVYDNLAITNFNDRYKALQSLNLEQKYPWIKIVPTYVVNSIEEFEQKEAEFIEQGYEGIIIRDGLSPYKFGRSTVNEGYLLKHKRFLDSEAEVLGWTPLYVNKEESEINELGYKFKHRRKGNLTETEAIGSFQVRDIYSGIEFDVPTSKMTKIEKEHYYTIADSLISKIINYKYQKVELNKPRFPTFRGFRDKLDL